MKSTKLFDENKVKKFFDILERLDDGFPNDETKQIYKGYEKNNPDVVYSQRDVFVNRTINKWFKGKYLIIYKTSKFNVTYKQYVSISNIKYRNDWSSTGYIDCYFINYCDVFENLFNRKEFKYNNTISLEGEWCLNGDKHEQLINMFKMDDVPEKEYVFKAYDFSKYPKKVKKDIDPKDEIQTTISFKAKTENEAYILKNKYLEDFNGYKDDMVITNEIVEVK